MLRTSFPQRLQEITPDGSARSRSQITRAQRSDGRRSNFVAGDSIAGGTTDNEIKTALPKKQTVRDCLINIQVPVPSQSQSQHLFIRSRREDMISQKPNPTSNLSPDTELPNPDALSPHISAATPRARSQPPPNRGGSPPAKDKKKRVSILGRLTGKKKDDSTLHDDDSELGEKRTEGMDAAVFSQPMGFIPEFPAPPKYVKVRAHNKKDKDFNRLFLAQELDGKAGYDESKNGGTVETRGINRASSAGKVHAIWALKFSVDGKHLAAGGQDGIVRVWAVISTAEDRRAHEGQEDASNRDGRGVRLNAPVFKQDTIRQYVGHTASVLDLSWSKNNFLLSSSMDKTVRLWHISRSECLCAFKHSDFVPSIQFHPKDDRFFLAGSLDSKLRLWSIVDKNVAYWTYIPNDMITAVAFTPDGKTAIVGCLGGQCIFYETEGLKQQQTLQVRSAYGKNSKGSKITGIQAMSLPPDDPEGSVKLLITSNDSRIRMYNFKDRSLEVKFKGNANSTSQIRASFSDDARYIVCGSEDRKVYIWPLDQKSAEKDKNVYEVFEAHSNIVTSSIFAPIATKRLLGASGDPIYDLCNPPPITLVSRNGSHASSDISEEASAAGDGGPTLSADDKSRETAKPPGYIARSTHETGNIIVTADFKGNIKVFRQDCAFLKRRHESWEYHSTLSKKILARTNSMSTRRSRDSMSRSSRASDTALSWRNSIPVSNPTAFIESQGGVGRHRSDSPNMSKSQLPAHASPLSQSRPFQPLTSRQPDRTPTSNDLPLPSPRIASTQSSLQSPRPSPRYPPLNNNRHNPATFLQRPLRVSSLRAIRPTYESSPSPKSPAVMSPGLLSPNSSRTEFQQSVRHNRSFSPLRLSSLDGPAQQSRHQATSLLSPPAPKSATLRTIPSVISSDSGTITDVPFPGSMPNESYVSRLTSELEYESDLAWRSGRPRSANSSGTTRTANTNETVKEGGSVASSESEERCRRCGGREFRAQQQGRSKRSSTNGVGLRLVCANCGMEATVGDGSGSLGFL